MRALDEYTSELRELVSRVPGPVVHDPKFPKLTIITPSYNQGQFLERTILSVLNQGYPNLDYIIIDGGSSDESVEVIEKYAPFLSYWVSEPDEGQVHALNKGFAKATGEWVAFQNSDDVYFPNTFQGFADASRKYPDASILYGDLFMITSEDEVTELLKTLPFSFRCQLIEGMQIHNQSLFFKKDLLNAYGTFDQSYRFAFDYEFITRYTSQNGVKARRIPTLAGALRVHEAAKSSTIAQVGSQEHKVIKEKFMRSNSSIWPEKIQYLCCRLRKIAYLFGQMDWKYIDHRNRIKAR